MMHKAKYYYNHKTLKFERYQPSISSRIFRALGTFSAILLTAGILYFVADTYLPSQKEKALIREIDQMRMQYEILENQIVALSENLETLRERDAGVHRSIFGMDPIDESVWDGGVGGHDKYAHLFDYENSGEIIVETHLKMDKLERQMQLQAKSLDSLEYLAMMREDRLSSVPSIKPVRADFLNKNVTRLSGYGMRMHPVHKVRRMHYGLDFTAPTGTAIQATGKGVVTEVRYSRTGYGRHVIIDHGFGFTTLYAHMRSIDISVGDQVVKGQKIGTVGNTGTSTAPHCHYEVRLNGQPVNPINYCLDGLTPDEYAIIVERASRSNQSFD